MSRITVLVSSFVAVTTIANWSPCLYAQTASFENEPINYQTAKVNDAVAQLIKRMESGETQLKFDKRHGYLNSLLTELSIPTSSQVLVFSKTSMQARKISPHQPRAIYFSDDVYVGYVQNGGVLEIGSTDSNQGPTFYSLNQKFAGSPKIVRDEGRCTVCHASGRTQNVPGYLVRSVFPNRAGHPNFGSGTYTTDHSSPFEKRWGGWYVTGTHGKMRHMGNQVFKENERKNFDAGANRKTLDGLLSTKPYLTAHSDIVALMVLEHQTQVQNAITFANFETRQALHQSKTMNKILGRNLDFVSDGSKRRIKAAAERLAEQLLMCGEFQLTDDVIGSNQYKDQFMALGKVDSRNRSLRELDLQTRLFKYPCSYLIHSESFTALPDPVRQQVVTRLNEVLSGRDNSKKFAHLSNQSRQAILEILRETNSEFGAK